MHIIHYLHFYTIIQYFGVRSCPQPNTGTQRGGPPRAAAECVSARRKVSISNHKLTKLISPKTLIIFHKKESLSCSLSLSRRLVLQIARGIGKLGELLLILSNSAYFSLWVRVLQAIRGGEGSGRDRRCL